jgi:Putative transposase/Transposase zinc-binding domain
MTPPRLEVAEVFREHADEYLAAHGASTAQRQVLRAIQNCRTAALGGHVEACDHCDHQRIAYNSCRNRHCPKCQGPATARWLEARAAELLPVPYFHLVLTLPSALGPVALGNPRVVYRLLLQAAAQSLLAVAADPKHLGAEIGFLAVLHTWGQNLLHHPHVHCVVPAGGISPDGARWIPCRPGFFLPVRVLSRVFRGQFIQGLKQAFARNELTFPGALAEFAAVRAFEQLLDQVVRHDWVIYAKRPFGGPEQVLKYLARYTHRVAISNERLIDLRNAQVTFRWKDYTQGGRPRRLMLAASEFIRRFLLHVLPTGFVKIRHYGFLANRFRSVRREQCRRLLNVPTPQIAATDREPRDYSADGDRESPLGRCPHCQEGRLRIVLRLAPQLPARRSSRPTETYFDTS